MDNFTHFAIEMAIALTAGVGLILAFQQHLKTTLTDICGREDRAQFWVRLIQMMMILAPIILVTVFSTAAQGDSSLLEVVRRAMLLSLSGEFIALIIIGRTVWSMIPSTEEKEIAATVDDMEACR